MKTIEIINLKLVAVNQELATFNCENSLTGVIHTTLSDTAVVLDGGYVLGQYDCTHCAIDALTNAYIKLHDSEKESGSYASYKAAFNSGFASSRPH